MGNLSLNFTAYPIGGPAYAFPNAYEYQYFFGDAFHELCETPNNLWRTGF